MGARDFADSVLSGTWVYFNWIGIFIMNELGEKLKKIRTDKGMTQALLAEKSGFTQETISNLEMGKSPNPKLATLVQIAEALGITLHDWLGFKVKVKK